MRNSLVVLFSQSSHPAPTLSTLALVRGSAQDSMLWSSCLRIDSRSAMSTNSAVKSRRDDDDDDVDLKSCGRSRIKSSSMCDLILLKPARIKQWSA